MHRLARPFALALTGSLLAGCNAAASSVTEAEPEVAAKPAEPEQDLRVRLPANPSAYIPPQCYVDTRDPSGGVHNPCFVCHHDAGRPNFIGDGEVQTAYDLPGPALTNRWTNLVADRRAALANIDEAELLAYVRGSNYREADQLVLANRLADLPAGWDTDADGAWDGYVPDAWFEFDAQGWDHSPEGARTGWRSYAFRPLPGAFFPSNGGSAGDALIRLPVEFRRNVAGEDDLEIYAINLAILEALITRADVAIDPADEAKLGVDLDGDGQLGVAARVHYRWAPLKGQTMRWVGAAGMGQDAGEIELAAGLFPVGTEILHSVRYLDVGPEGAVSMAARMKELRYARKRRWLSYSDLDEAAGEDGKERRDFPDRVREVVGDLERGADNGMGWIYQGFIEDVDGELRPQTVEETLFCVGCHSGVGATDDGIYSFGRKLADTDDRGWRPMGRPGAPPIGDMLRADGRREYATYLIENGAGDDFRSNGELLARFFDAAGEPRMSAIEGLVEDASPLLTPSGPRALALDAAYRMVVREQSYAKGRDAVLAPTPNLHMNLDPAQPTGIEKAVHGPRDPRR